MFLKLCHYGKMKMIVVMKKEGYFEVIKQNRKRKTKFNDITNKSGTITKKSF